MPGFTSYDDIVNEVTVNGKSLRWDFFKIGTTMQGNGFWHSLWRREGTPSLGAAPATTPGTAYTSGAGGMKWADTSPDIKSILSVGATVEQNCTLMIYDRLVGVSTVSLTTTGNKTISSTTLPRYTSGVGVQAWLEMTTASTTTQGVVAMNSYTNQAGTTGRAGGNISLPAAATVVDTMVGPLPMAAGDTGVKAVSTINVVTATTAGVANLILIRPLLYLPINAYIWTERDMVLQVGAMETVFDGATLGMAILASTTTASDTWGSIKIAYG